MSKKNNSVLQKIYSDRTSGSADILQELHEHLRNEQKMLEVFPGLITEIKDQFKTFQSVQSYLNELEKVLLNHKRLDNFFDKYDVRLSNVYDRIFDKCKHELKKHRKIITISNSKTVLEILLKLKEVQSKLSVTVCESRPKFEGKILSKKLSEAGIEIDFIIDAAISSCVPKMDAAIIGADTILKNGNVVNKSGSSALAVLCKYYSIPFYVVADKQKISNSNKFEQKEMPPGEIWRQSNSRIKIENLYFEQVDKSLITKIFTA